ncbi:hypothetical protein SO802_001915 [Lithocarpus litseifolius]|uniref:PIN-like protein n=1 Tax=Lithocarpus litseifolius TaxID=425828 RepID=A0AAW2DWP3_9ROSI
MFGYTESSPKHGYTRTRDRFSPYASPDHLMLLGSTSCSNYRKMKYSVGGGGGGVPNNKQGLHMFVWSTSSSPISDVHNSGRHAFSTTSTALKHDSTTPGGLSMALQPKIIACGKPMAAFTMVVRFLIGPAVIAATSLAVGLHGVLLQIVIVQAALPLAIVPFVYAKEYDVPPDIIGTL